MWAAALIAATLSAAQVQPVADLADGRIGRIEFVSPTPTGPTQLVQRASTISHTVVGELRLPDGIGGRVPAVIIAHGSGGASQGREGAWAARLAKLGIATFIVDSFNPRGLATTSTDQGRLSTMANLADALSALKLLASHPRIDPARIAVMGFSRGGQVALYAALEPLRRGIIDGELRFAAHVALYPSCSLPYRAQRLGGKPILMLLGELDDYTPAEACLRYAEWFRGQGNPIETIVYPGAHHDFDIPAPPKFVANLQTAKSCDAEVLVETGIMRRLDTGEELRGTAVGEYLRACSSRGATYGGNPAVLAQAERDVADFLRRTLKLD